MIAVYCDASHTRRFTGLAAVAIDDGAVLWVVVSWGRFAGAHEAELSAITLGAEEVRRRGLRCARLYTDSASAANESGATWVPRERNALADRLAGAARVGDRRTLEMYRAQHVAGPR